MHCDSASHERVDRTVIRVCSGGRQRFRERAARRNSLGKTAVIRGDVMGNARLCVRPGDLRARADSEQLRLERKADNRHGALWRSGSDREQVRANSFLGTGFHYNGSRPGGGIRRDRKLNAQMCGIGDVNSDSRYVGSRCGSCESLDEVCILTCYRNAERRTHRAGGG
jgi:hypothetical protein